MSSDILSTSSSSSSDSESNPAATEIVETQDSSPHNSINPVETVSDDASFYLDLEDPSEDSDESIASDIVVLAQDALPEVQKDNNETSILEDEESEEITFITRRSTRNCYLICVIFFLKCRDDIFLNRGKYVTGLSFS